MKTPSASRCDQDKVVALLENRLGEDAQAEVERHLDQCPSCRDFLERQCAADDIWNKAAAYLRDEVCELVPLAGAARLDELPDRRINVLRQVIDGLAPSDDPEMLGRVSGYEVIGAVGYGGMGVVLKGYDPALKRVVAIKMLAPHLATSESSRTRFAREAQAAAAVTHDNVVQIYSVDEANGLPYLVMPFSRGPSLQKRIDQRGALELVEVLRIGYQIASGLAAFHAQGLVHRDIKPANILLSEQVDRLMITDFGLARAVDDASVTSTGVIAGTPQFMSPEQARGQTVDARSDLFSLGSLLYVLCTGKPPFAGESSYGVLRQVTDGVPEPIQALHPSTPTWLCHIIGKLQEKSPSRRYQSADEVAQLLQKCLAHVQDPASVELPRGELPRGTSARARLLHRAGIAALVIMAVTVWWAAAQLVSTSDTIAKDQRIDNPPSASSPSATDAASTDAGSPWPGVSESEAHQITRHHIKALIAAIHAYADAHDGQLPPPIVPHAELPQHRRLSGLVLLLPFFSEKPEYLDDATWQQIRIAPEMADLARQVYQQIDLSKAWDDAANDTAARTLLPMFLTPGAYPVRDEEGLAVSHFAFVRGYVGHDNGAFPVDREVYIYHPDSTQDQIGDGSSATLAVGQISDDLGPWIAAGTSTARFLIHPNERDNMPGFGSPLGDACVFANCDARVIFVDLGGSTPLGLESLVTRFGKDHHHAVGNVRTYDTAEEWKKSFEAPTP